ncbi:sodium/proton antiporter, NhaA family [Georgenia satyanarayanai]|uniref:Na(+)/H(+) antiporter NhaA n=1 Tax=Georgenia satyanarayanai TaxID=860221 RepID=A0A2Y9AGQ3_9MICO|nr:Na+/H+ antiporter NhaA [Georgenia satyanarayanai]PYF99207.1 sodium/proton antiporter (NhaA family) [Georgenia satyanarayanai]SSA43325.1 sodium/proton antiporter, NhaA family [Georgenia satyanarayanai]
MSSASTTASGPFAAYREKLGNETFAGMVLLVGALVALVWANSPWRDAYVSLSEVTVGPAALHLDLTLAAWASDGLLAIFFFAVGLELKQEFVTGSLRDARTAAVPVIAAFFGVAGPVAVYLLVQAVTGSGIWDGWPVPVATDIAFAVALLGIFGRGFPAALRLFLLTLAVVDDLIGIVIIAVVFADGLNYLLLAAAFLAVVVFAVLVRRRITAWWVLIPVGVVAWAFMHASGVHATIAGVLLGMVVPAVARAGEDEDLSHQFEHRISWISAGFVLPVFAFFAAGVNVVDSGGLLGIVTDPVSIGISLGLPLGKLLGIWGGTALLVTLTPLALGKGLNLKDMVGMSLLAGVGFTVSLLIAQLAFEPGSVESSHARVGVLLGSLLSALLGGLALRVRARTRDDIET